LVWDGEINLGHRDLKLGKVIIVLAGSQPNLPKIMEMAKSMQLKFEENFNETEKTESTKIVDLLSRINGGVLKIPSLDIVQDNRDRRVDKICIAIALLQSRFGVQLTGIPKSLLRFISITKFRYGVRSIAHLIDLIPHISKPKSITHKLLKLPLDSASKLKNSSLAYHLIDEDQALGIIEKWKNCSANNVELTIGMDAISDAYNTDRFSNI
jgi:hypothetical protein